MADLTDDDILELAERLAADLDLDPDQRNAIVLGVQRLVWPPSSHAFLHEPPHIEIEVVPKQFSGWRGKLRCQHGCVRVWRVSDGPSADAVHGALTAAHAEYRTGKVTSVVAEAPNGLRRIDLATILGRSVPVEVTDERI